MGQIHSDYKKQFSKISCRNALVLLLFASVVLLTLSRTLFAAQDSENITDQLQKAMIHTAQYNPQRLSEYQERIADIFCEAAENGLETELLQAFPSLWKSLSESGPNENRFFVNMPSEIKHKAYSGAQYILAQYFNKIQETEVRTNSSLKLFDPLQSLVFPPNEEQTIDLGWYEDVGGTNGFYRTFAEYLVERAITENRLEDLAVAVKQRRDKIVAQLKDTDKLKDQEKKTLRESILKCDLIEMLVALQQHDKEQIAALKKRFFDAIQKNELPESQAELWTIFALVPAYSDAELFTQVDDLLEEATGSLDKAKCYPRYYCYLMPRILPMALKHSKVNRAVELARAYRNFHKKRYDKAKHVNHLRFATGTRFYELAMATDSPAELAAVIGYFNELPADHLRRPNLLPLLDRLESLMGDSPEADRKKLLGDLNLSAIRNTETFRKIPESSKPLVADRANLPELPSGKLFFSDNFDQTPNSAWSSDRRDINMEGTSTFLGAFIRDKIQLRLSDLPAHKLVRVRFDLLIMGTTDGLMGLEKDDKENSYGPDYWELYTNNKVRLIATTFTNFSKDPYDHKQSYPDDCPIAFGVQPTWYNRFYSIKRTLWSSKLEMGCEFGRAGAAAERSRDLFDRSATYAIDLVFPHDAKTLELNFRDDFRDGKDIKDKLTANTDETWALDHVRIELIDEFWTPTPEELSQCLKALSGDDSIAANVARWRLVAAGNQAVKKLEEFSQTSKGKELSKATKSFIRFRIERLLEIIGTEEAKELRRKWFGPNLAWDSKVPSTTFPVDPWQLGTK